MDVVLKENVFVTKDIPGKIVQIGNVQSNVVNMVDVWTGFVSVKMVIQEYLAIGENAWITAVIRGFVKTEDVCVWRILKVIIVKRKSAFVTMENVLEEDVYVLKDTMVRTAQKENVKFVWMEYVTLRQENASVSQNMKENFVKRKNVNVRITGNVMLKVNVFVLLNFMERIVKLKDVN